MLSINYEKWYTIFMIISRHSLGDKINIITCERKMGNQVQQKRLIKMLIW